MQDKFVARAPKVNCDSLEKFRDGPLAHPDEEGIEYARSQDELRTKLAMPDLFFGVVDADCGDVVGPVDEHDVYKAHACEEWKQGEEHDPVFAKQLVASDFPARQTREDDDGGEACCPPAVEQGGMVCQASASIWRSAGPDGTLLKSSSRHGGGINGCELRPEAELEVARSACVALDESLWARVDAMEVMVREERWSCRERSTQGHGFRGQQRS